MRWTLAINALHSNLTDQMWILFSNVPIWSVLYVTVIVLMFRRLGWKRALLMTAATALCIVCVDQSCNFVKESVARLRPCNDQRMIDAGLRMLTGASQRHPYGFFSGHAGNAFAFAVCSLTALRCDIRQKWRGYAAGIFFWASMVSASRIFVGKHYLGDIVIGALAGSLLALMVCTIAKWIDRKYLSSAIVQE